MKLLLLLSYISADLIGYNRNWNNIEAHFRHRVSNIHDPSAEEKFDVLNQISIYMADHNKGKVDVAGKKSFKLTGPKTVRKPGRSTRMKNLRINRYIRRMNRLTVLWISLSNCNKFEIKIVFLIESFLRFKINFKNIRRWLLFQTSI